MYITHKILMSIPFLIVKDVVNPIAGLDALHQNAVQFHLIRVAKLTFSNTVQRQFFATSGITTIYSSGLVLQGFLRGSLLEREDPEYTVFDSHPQITNQIVAEIDFEVNS